MTRTGIIVAVESYLLRKGMVAILNRIPGLTVIREFDSASLLTEFIQTRSRDLLLISQSLFDSSTELFINGGAMPEKTILLTNGKKDNAGDRLHSIDVDNSKEEILLKIQDLLEAQPKRIGQTEISGLSPREKTIVRLVSLGYTNKQIAEELFLSAHTVITHRKNIGHKLGIKSVSGLTVYAIVNNIITIEEVNSKSV